MCLLLPITHTKFPHRWGSSVGVWRVLLEWWTKNLSLSTWKMKCACYFCSIWSRATSRSCLPRIRRPPLWIKMSKMQWSLTSAMEVIWRGRKNLELFLKWSFRCRCLRKDLLKLCSPAHSFWIRRSHKHMDFGRKRDSVVNFWHLQTDIPAFYRIFSSIPSTKNHS